MTFDKKNYVRVSMEDLRRWIKADGVTLPDQCTFVYVGQGSSTTDPLIVVEWDQHVIGEGP